jgi:hypothetical protein
MFVANKVQPPIWCPHKEKVSLVFFNKAIFFAYFIDEEFK